jgi:UPF0271 protein
MSPGIPAPSLKRVLDTSAFLSGRQIPGELLTVPEVLSELRRKGTTVELEAVLATRVSVASAQREGLERVREASETTGDLPRLSPTDLALIALALEASAVLVTDDYSIQNVARSLGIPFEQVMERGIREQWRWSYQCTGCGRTWPEFHRECPICGSPLRTARPRVTRDKG